MNSPNQAALLRTLIIYAVCVPLAVVVGYMLTNPMDYSTLGLFGVLALLLVSPILLRWHHPLLILSWNLGMTLFFIKGSPSLWLVMAALSVGISLLERTLNSEMHFIRVPQITWPLLCLTAVVLVTAKLTGGLGFHAFGSDVYGGRKYIYVFIGIASYFALTSRRIPPERAKLYVGLFFLGGLSSAIGDFFAIMPSWSHFLYLFFPPTIYSFNQFEVGETRLSGVAGAAITGCLWLLARYGIRGIFLEGKLWRAALWVLCFVAVFLGGFRSGIVGVMVPFVLMFFLEGLHRTRLLPVAILAGSLLVAIVIPLAPHLPYTFQRALAFLPLDISSDAREAAQGSLDWRVNMWKALLPQVPQYLFLGKGMAISPEDYNEMMGTPLGQATGYIDPSQDPLALAYDYHNGVLSVLLPFGIWGMIAYLWLMAASLFVLYRNWKYGRTELRSVNALLFAVILFEFASFMSCFAGLSLPVAIPYLAGRVGLSVALNGGVCRPEPEAVPAREPLFQPQRGLRHARPQPAFPR